MLSIEHQTVTAHISIGVTGNGFSPMPERHGHEENSIFGSDACCLDWHVQYYQRFIGILGNNS